MNIGFDIELLFEQRLRQLGYRGACRPAREDCGVDYVLFTTKGWVGIQVKSARPHNRNTKKRGCIQSNSLRIKFAAASVRGRTRTVDYFKRCGVTVFAVHYAGIFYLIPIEESGERGVYCTINSPFREAWHEVIGLPVQPLTLEDEREQEVVDMETLFSESPS